jgi:biotin carboxylase
MRSTARAAGHLVPEFVHTVNAHGVASFLDSVPPPWMLKPRSGASAMGMRLLDRTDDVWRVLGEIDTRESERERTSRFLLEQFVAGDVFHVDSLVSDGAVVFANAARYGTPPFDVAEHGGVSTSSTIERGSADERALLTMNEAVLADLGLDRGVAHVEFIRGTADGRLYFLEAAARVGGAYTVETVEAATGVNLWREWARLETATPDRPYGVPPARNHYGGIAVSLSRQEYPDTSSYADPEIVFRVRQAHHVGLVVSSPDYDRVVSLLAGYARRFAVDFTAVAPREESPEHHL